MNSLSEKNGVITVTMSDKQRLFLAHCIEEWFRQSGTSDQEQDQRDIYFVLTGEEATDWWKTDDESEKMKNIIKVKSHFLKLGVSEVITHEAANEFVYEDLEGNFDSVITAGMTKKYDLETLKGIFRLGLKQYLGKVLKRAEIDKEEKE